MVKDEKKIHGIQTKHYPCCSDPAINRMVPSSQWKMTRQSDVVRDEPICTLIRLGKLVGWSFIR